MTLFTSIASLALFAYVIKRLVDLLLDSKANRPPYPPGPPPKPLVANMFDFPTENAAATYMEWEKKYNSPILHGESLGNHVLIVNSQECAEEIFESNERAKIYATRPTMAIIEPMGWDYNFALLPYGEEWRHHRKICQQIFSQKATQGYEPLQTRKIRQMLQGLHETPEEFENHNKMLSTTITMTLMYGYDVQSIDDPAVGAADKSIVLANKLLSPGGNLIDIIPALKHIPQWFPGASSVRIAAEVKRLTEEMIRIPLEFVKKSFEEGTAVPSLVTDFYERKYTVGASEDEERRVKNIAYTVYGAAAETTVTTTTTLFYAMATNPAVQKRAQEEIDRVIGSKRLPTLADRDSLPYIEAIYREVLRFGPPLPIGVPHSTSEDDYWRGYFIPKGTAVFGNIWAMTRNEEIYPEPNKFRPERFLDEQGNLSNDNRILAYGFGRRLCIGKHVASTTMWLTIASLLATFNITKAKDEDGNEIEITDEYKDYGLISQKTKFECSFQVRSEAAKALLVDGA